MQPKVSIVIPVYNVEKYILHCLDTAINQTLREIEIIIVNDGSKDKCPQIIGEYAAKDKRIVAIHKENGGLGSAYNTGINQARGEYVALFEPDDYIELDMYEKLYRRARQTNADIVRCEFNIVQDGSTNGHPHYCWDVPEKTVFTLEEAPSFVLYRPSVWAALYKKSFLDNKKLRFPVCKGAGFVDINFKQETFFASEIISYIRDTLYNYRVNSNSSIKQGGDPDLEIQRWKETDQALAKYSPRVEKLKKYLYKTKYDTFYWAYTERVHNKHQKILLREWHKYFQSLAEDVVLNDHSGIFSHAEKRIFKYVRRGWFTKLKWFIFRQKLRSLISIRIKSRYAYIHIMNQCRLLLGFRFRIAKLYMLEFCIGRSMEL